MSRSRICETNPPGPAGNRPSGGLGGLGPSGAAAADTVHAPTLETLQSSPRSHDAWLRKRFRRSGPGGHAGPRGPGGCRIFFTAGESGLLRTAGGLGRRTLGLASPAVTWRQPRPMEQVRRAGRKASLPTWTPTEGPSLSSLGVAETESPGKRRVLPMWAQLDEATSLWRRRAAW